MSIDAERLYSILSSERFLSMQGLANEVPIFIHAYNVADEDRVAAMIKSLGSRLRNAGIQIAEVDLFELLLAELREEGLLDDVIADESTFDRKSLLGDLKNYADASRLVPRLVDMMENTSARVSLLSGVGHIFPFLRAHALLDSIQPAMMRHPVVLFFPGEYIQVPGHGSELRLFGSMPGEGYYRAFNLDHYRL
jgi:Domain of unknown function (DUF1788)